MVLDTKEEEERRLSEIVINVFVEKFIEKEGMELTKRR